MLEKLVQDLSVQYQEDLKDYEELLGKMRGFQSFLHSHEISSNRREEEQTLDNSLEKELTDFSSYRESVFHRLRDRAVKTAALQSEISLITELPFEGFNLKSFLNEAVHSRLSFLAENVRKKMKEVLELDQQILPRLEMELEAVKLEIHRLQDARRTKNAYGNHALKEARFIDKSK